MAWNGSDGEKVKGKGQGQQRRDKHSSVRLSSSPSPKFNYKALVAGLVVVIGGAIAAWMMMRGEGVKDEGLKGERVGESQISEVAPQVVTNAVVQAEKRRPTREEKRLAEIKYFEDKYGTNMPAGIKAHVYYLKNPPDVHRPKTEYGFFRHGSDRQIASVMAIEPGAFMLEPLQFGESFNKDFLASLLDKTEILPTDDEETRLTKEAVADLKKEIIAAQKAEGKLPNEILNEHMAALYELSKFEQNIENELNAVRNDPDVTDQEIEDLFRASNKMRAERGLPERKIPDFSKRSIRLQKKLSKRKAKQ